MMSKWQTELLPLSHTVGRSGKEMKRNRLTNKQANVQTNLEDRGRKTERKKQQQQEQQERTAGKIISTEREAMKQNIA